MLEGELPYLSAYPPVYVVTAQSPKSFEVKEYTLVDGPGRELDSRSSLRNLLAEAYRGMHRRYGDTLYFSNPRPMSSFVFRSEREFLKEYSGRFAWALHFFQSATRGQRGEVTRNYDLRPERYAGFLFLRPWEVHVQEARKEEAYKTSTVLKMRADEITCEDLCFGDFGDEEIAAPAICEGYLRPPISLLRSPFHSQCLDFYAKPYGVLPFLSIPFFSSHFGAACGHCCASTALLLAKARTILSPYEFAVESSRVLAQENTEAVEGFAIEKVQPHTLCTVANQVGAISPTSEYYFPPKEDLSPITEKAQVEFSDRLCAYLYQGIPILYPVDRKILYDGSSEQEAAEPGGTCTEPDDIHIILIHSMARPSKGRVHYFVFSDSTDLHQKGDVFHRVSCKRLWIARVRISPESSEFSQPYLRSMPKAQHSDGALFIPCLPFEFIRTYDDVLSAHAQEVKHSVSILLRDRSQLRGFLLNRLLPHAYDTLSTAKDFQAEFRLFREYLRQLDLPKFVWVVEHNTEAQSSEYGVVGKIIDTRGNDKTFISGEFDQHAGYIRIRGMISGAKRGEGMQKEIAVELKDNKIKVSMSFKVSTP